MSSSLRKHTEEELRASEEALRRVERDLRELIETIPAMAFVNGPARIAKKSRITADPIRR
jgi:hypothetical protein